MKLWIVYSIAIDEAEPVQYAGGICEVSRVRAVFQRENLSVTAVERLHPRRIVHSFSIISATVSR